VDGSRTIYVRYDSSNMKAIALNTQIYSNRYLLRETQTFACRRFYLNLVKCGF